MKYLKLFLMLFKADLDLKLLKEFSFKTAATVIYFKKSSWINRYKFFKNILL